MSRSLMMPAIRYPSIGKCIFCLEPFPPDQLTDEHIIPFALNGAAQIVKGSCRRCAQLANESYEQTALNSDLYLPRMLLQLRRRKKKQKKKLPSVGFGDRTMGGELNIELDISKYPRNMVLVMFEPAGNLVGINRGSDLVGARFCFFNFWFHDPKPPPGGITVMSRMCNGPFAMTLAKIAYCHGIAKLGIDGFDGAEIRALLRGDRSDVYNFVGGPSDNERPGDDHLHALYLRRRGPTVTVLVHLFASCKMAHYEVAIGAAR